MAQLLLDPHFSEFDDNGDPLSGGLVYTYENGTTTDKETYTTATLGVANTNPVVLDTRGEAMIYLSGIYTIVVTDSDGGSIWTADNVEGQGSTVLDFHQLSEYADLATAITAIGATETTLYIDADDTMAANVTIPATLDIIGMNGHSITTTGYTLTLNGSVKASEDLFAGTGTIVINGSFEAGYYRVFSGASTRTFDGAEVMDIIPHWFESDPYTDGFESIRAAMRAATTGGDSARSVYIPAGDYTIDTTGVFSDLGTTANIGIKVRGAGWNSTRLLLSPPGAADIWFYNNLTTERLQFPVFKDIGFFGKFSPWTYATASNYTKGFRIYSTAATGNHEQGFRFIHCNFIGLHTVFQTAGDQTGSETTFVDCRINHIKNVVLDLNNPQTLNHSFINTDVDVIWGDFIRVGAAGGGSVKVYGGSWIAYTGAAYSAADEYVIDIPASSATGSNSSIFTFNGVRFEQVGDNAKLINADGVGGQLEAIFRDCIFWSATRTGAITGWVTMAQYKQVFFDRCNFSYEDSTKYETYVLNSLAQYGQPGHIKWDNCIVHDDLSEHITFTSNFGRATANGCSGHSNGAFIAEPYMLAMDFDMFGGSASTDLIGGNSDSNIALKTSSLLYGATFPFNNTLEGTLMLPKGALIKAIRVQKNAVGASVNAFCLHVGNNNKSTIYVSSIPEDESHAHRIDYERGSTSVAQITTRTDDNTATFTFQGGNHSISKADTVNVNWVLAGAPGRRSNMTITSIVMTTQGRIVMILDGGEGDVFPAVNTDCYISSVLGFIDVGATDNERIVRLWSSNGDTTTASGAGGQTGGYAIVEYY